jgi:predicted permease
MREWLARLVDWFRREQLDRELEEELRFHRAQLERDATRAGPGADPAVEARRRLGNTTIVREAARERWSLPWLDHLQQDVRHALRGLRRSPGFAVGVIATLGLGIGANAAMFGIIDRLMFRPLVFLRDPATVHRVYLQYQHRDRLITTEGFEYTRYLDLQRWTTSFSQFAAFFPHTRAVGTGDASRERRVAAVSAGFFSFFDAPPALGRYFLATEDSTPRGAEVAVLDYGFWQTEFGGRNVLGETVQVGNIPCRIVGVAPKGFRGVAEDNAPEVYLPITTYAGSQAGEDGRRYFLTYNWGWMEMMVRRKGEVSPAAATADLTQAFVQSWNAERVLDPDGTPAQIAKPRAIAGPLKTAAGPNPGLEAQTLLWVTGVAAIVLLIACANVANLFLARTLKRRHEVALRLALGVRRGRLVAQSLTEGLVLSLVGCSVGVLIARWGGLALHRVFVGTEATFDLIRDGRTLGVALAAALLAGVVTGIAPVLLGGGADLARTLKAGARDGSSQRSPGRSALLVIQGTLSVVLLVGAGLFVRSLSNVRAMRLGFDPEPVLMVMRNLRGTAMSDGEQDALGRRLLEAAQALPEVEAATWVSSVPFWSTSSTSLFVAGIDSVSRLGRFTYQTASGDYFRAMGTRLLRGRGFTEADRAGAPRVAVVSEDMARILWPGKDALGECLRVGADTMPCTTVVGIAENAVQNSLSESAQFRYYLPIDQHDPSRGFALMLRMRTDPGVVAEGVRKALQRVMPGMTYVTVRPMRDLIDGERRSWKLGATMFVAFGGLALVVAAVGLYSVIGYNVAQRTHELGVRIALGARAGTVVRMVVGQGVWFGWWGVVIGSGLALGASRWLEPLLFRQSARDPAVFGAVAGVLLLVAVVASSLPAWRAARADPSEILREGG